MASDTIRKEKLNEQAASFVAGILILIVILITATQALCYWIPGWWRKEYAKYDTPQYVTGEMSLDDAVHVACGEHYMAQARIHQSVKQIGEERLAIYGCHGLGHVAEDVAESCAEASCQYDRFVNHAGRGQIQLFRR